MSKSFKGQPILSTKCDATWIPERREIILRKGYAVRAGAGNTIELKTLTRIEDMAGWDPLRLNQWAPLALPGEAIRFLTRRGRDAVLQRLTEPHST